MLEYLIMGVLVTFCTWLYGKLENWTLAHVMLGVLLWPATITMAVFIIVRWRRWN